MSRHPSGPQCGQWHCITCGDDGEPMVVLRVDERRELALCQAGSGERTSVEVALVAPVSPGERVLVHAGTAIALLDGEAGS
jgi:hydrogenase maturation factor